MTDIPTITQEEAVEVRAYRKKPVVIDAVHLPTRDKAGAEIGVCTGGSGCKSKAPDGAWPHVHTLEGDHTWTPGDWIITGVKGERYFCKPDIFEATYEPAALSPNMDHAVGGVREDGNLAGYQMAFYELAKIMGIGARVATPGHVWRTEMLPRLLAAFAATPPVNQDAVREALEEALDFLLSVASQRTLGDGLDGALRTLARKIKAALATPPLDNTGLDAATVERCAMAARERKAPIYISEQERELCYEHAERIALAIEALASGDRS